MRPSTPEMASPATLMARSILRGDKDMSDEEATRAVASYIRSWLPVDERDRAEKIGAEAVRDAREYLKKPKKTLGIDRRRALVEEVKKELQDAEVQPRRIVLAKLSTEETRAQKRELAPNTHDPPKPVVLHERRDPRSGPPDHDAA